MAVGDLRIEEFDYPLPESRIATHPLAERDKCLLLVKDESGHLSTHIFSELPQLLPEDSMLVCNNTRVINARLRFRKGADGDGALIEIFCLEPSEPADYACNFASTGRCAWTCFVGNSKRWKSGVLSMKVSLRDGRVLTLSAERIGREGNTSVISFSWDNPDVTFSEIIGAVGEIPIPPYLNRQTEESDAADYQTIFSHIEGSVAAPTAGLHFTPQLLDAIDGKGILRRELTLHVGAGTFQPVKSDLIADHDMHSEFIAVARPLIEELATETRPVIAVGTTSVRTLESLYHLGCRLASGLSADCMPQWYPYDPSHPRLSVAGALRAILAHLDATGEDTFVASTRLMIAPGYDYRIVKGMVTNFHQPRSTLLLLVSAFLGQNKESGHTHSCGKHTETGSQRACGEQPATAPNPTAGWRELYDFALADPRYRFLSYGDACLLL